MNLAAEHIRNLRVVLDRVALLELLPKHAVVAELGVDNGDYSAKILHYAAPRELHLIDLWDSERFNEAKMLSVHERFRDQLADGSVVIHRNSSCAALAKFPDHYFDWIYLDTSHCYDDTKAELSLCRHKVRPGGLIAGHDYTTGNMDRCVKYGVIDAVNEFCVEHRWEMLHLTHEPRRYLSFTLREIGAAT